MADHICDVYDFVAIKKIIDNERLLWQDERLLQPDDEIYDLLDILFEELTVEERLKYLRNKLEANDNEENTET